MRTTLFTIVVVFMTALQVTAQETVQEVVADADKGYYVKNSVLYDGIYFNRENRMERSKRLSIVKQLRHEAITYHPEDIEEYGFPNGKKYVSAVINFNGSAKSVFLEEVVNIQDSVIVFLYCSENNDDMFFLLRGQENRFEMVNSNAPDEIWNIFRSLNNCSNVDGIENFPKKLNTKTINVFYRAYNDCNPNLFPKPQLGAVANVGLGKPQTNEFPYYKYNLDLVFSIGLFAQLPFDECMALRIEALYSFLDNKKGTLKNYSNSAEYKRNSIQTPLLFRYSFNYTKGKNIPYMEAGPCFDIAFSGGKYRNGILQKLPKGTILDDYSIINFMYGFSLGTGIEHKINNQKSLHFGLRYNWLKGYRQEYVEKFNFLSLSLAYSLF